jgi:hypothetical protein
MAQTFEEVLRDCGQVENLAAATCRLTVRLSPTVLSALASLDPGSDVRRPGTYPIEDLADDYQAHGSQCTFEIDTVAMLRAVNDRTIDVATLKIMRRRYVLKHHPDRMSDLEMSRKATQALSDVNVGIDDRSR